jgi:hypothetical protein
MGDYLVPTFKLESNLYEPNKYSLMILNYLKENKKALYEELLYTGRLNKFLKFNSDLIQNKVNFLIDSYIEKDKEINEKLKESNQMKWVSITPEHQSGKPSITGKNSDQFLSPSIP